ncbi:MAG: EamA family transporter [Candidatus Heimdallarchaeota archaeon]
MPPFSDNFLILGTMMLYGVFSGGSAIILKKGIIRAGGIQITHFFRDLLPAIWRLASTPLWLFGGFIAVIGFLIYAYALNSYEVSVVKPLVNTNLLFTFLFAYVIFHEKLSWLEWMGVSTLVAGILFTAFSPGIGSTDLINVPLLYLLFPLTLIIAFIMILVMFILKRGSAEFAFPVFAGIFFGMGTFFTKSLLIGYSELETLTYALLFIYSLLMLMVTYGFAALGQQLAFEKGRLSVVSPISNSLTVITSLVGAKCIFFETFDQIRLLGIACILVSLFILRREIDRSKL